MTFLDDKYEAQRVRNAENALAVKVRPIGRRDILRGTFAIVETTGVDGQVETRLVLQGFEPENRKLVYEFALGTSIESHYLFSIKRQDSPGLAKADASAKRDGWPM